MSAIRPFPLIALRAWRRLGWRHWALVGGCGALVGAIQPLVHFEINFAWAHWRVLFDTPYWIVAGWLFMGAIALADASVPRDHTPSMKRYSAWLAVAAAMCTALALAIAPHVPWPPSQVIAGKTFKGTFHTVSGKRVHGLINRYALPAVLHGTLGAFMFIMVRNSQRATRALAQAELGRSEAARRLLESRIAAAHGQVDPDAMLRALVDIEQAYDRDPARAETMMDRLIETLREAMPRLRAKPHA